MYPAQKLILKHLQDDDLNLREIASKINMKPKHATYHLNILIKKRLIKHVGWKEITRGKPLRIFSIKINKKEAGPYQKITKTEESRRYREKYKAILIIKRELAKKNAGQKKVDTNLFFI